MRMRKILNILIASSLLSLSACTSTLQYGEATRTKTVKQDAGNDELVFVTEKMMKSLITYPTLEEIFQKKRLSLAISPLVNQTSDTFDLGLVKDSMTKQLSRSGKFSINDKTNLAQAFASITKNDLFAHIDINVARKMAAKTRSDYLLYGSLRNVIRTKATNKEVYYSVDLHLLDKKRGKIIWQDNEEILKSRKKAIFGI